MNPRLFGLFLLLGCSACGEGEGAYGPHLTERDNILWAEAGATYRLDFAEPVDRHPIGALWDSESFLGSPLEFMSRVAIILKVDDQGGEMSSGVVRFIELADRYQAVVSIGIITTHLTADPQINSVYRQLHDFGFELWFHGHTHAIVPDVPEFQGAGLAAQMASFREGLEVAYATLGVELRAFGAPGNATDADTVTAIGYFPQLVAWLFGPDGADGLGEVPLVLPRLLNIEARIGDVLPPTAFLLRLDALLQERPEMAPLTLQLHPNGFDAEDLDRCGRIFQEIRQRRLFRYTSPFAWWKWRADRGRIVLVKTSQTSYVLDLSDALYDHRLEIAPDGPIPLVQHVH